MPASTLDVKGSTTLARSSPPLPATGAATAAAGQEVAAAETWLGVLLQQFDEHGR